MAGSKKHNPFDGETPSRGQRVDALGERLSELRTKLGALSEAGPDSERLSSLPDAGVVSEREPSDDDKLALLVFNTVKGDSRRLRLFVQRLARLEAAAAKKAKDEDKR